MSDPTNQTPDNQFQPAPQYASVPPQAIADYPQGVQFVTSGSSAPPPPAPDRKRGSGLGIAAMIIGITAIIFAFTPIAGFGLVLAIVGLVLGIIALVRKPATKGPSIAGITLSAVAVPIAIVFLVIYALAGAVVKATSELPGDAAGVASGATKPTPAAVKPTPAAVAPQPVADTNAWYNKTYGTFDTISKAGTGDSVVALPANVKGGIVTASYQGSGNFSISVIDATNQPTGELLVNTIGTYSGVTAYGLNDLGNTGVNLQVTADSAWTITIAPMASAPTLTLPGSATGDQVYKYDGNAANWAFTNSGAGNFAVIQHSTSLMPNLAINEIGPYQGTVPMLAGPSVVAVTSDGNWTVAVG